MIGLAWFVLIMYCVFTLINMLTWTKNKPEVSRVLGLLVQVIPTVILACMVIYG